MTAIILVSPQKAENIGMVARAMMNCGVLDLRLVRPRDGWPLKEAWPASAGATAVLDNARVYASLTSAIADLTHIYATTARRRFMQKKPIAFTEFGDHVTDITTHHRAKVGILFGNERSGLSNEDIVPARAVFHIPVNPDFPSLNLAQAVFAVCHQLFLSSVTKTFHDIHPMEAVANAEERDNFFSHLENALDHTAFFQPVHKRPQMVQNLRNLFLKADLTSQEVRTLRGVIRALSQNT